MVVVGDSDDIAPLDSGDINLQGVADTAVDSYCCCAIALFTTTIDSGLLHDYRS